MTASYSLSNAVLFISVAEAEIEATQFMLTVLTLRLSAVMVTPIRTTVLSPYHGLLRLRRLNHRLQRSEQV
jgi:hypothetical protein